MCVACGVLCVVYCVWCIMCGVLCVLCGVLCVVYCVWCIVCSVLCVLCGVLARDQYFKGVQDWSRVSALCFEITK